MFVFETKQMAGPRYIVNFPTKRHWRGKSRMADIEIGLDALAEAIKQRNIRSIALPPLGSGLGGLDWSRSAPANRIQGCRTSTIAGSSYSNLQALALMDGPIVRPRSPG